MSFQVVYKVVKPTTKSDECISAVVVQEELCTLYRVHQWTKPKIGKLFAFRTLDAARAFRQNYPDHHLYKGLASSAEDIALAPNISLSLVLIKRFWASQYHPMGRLPYGTVICSSIKLMERII